MHILKQIIIYMQFFVLHIFVIKKRFVNVFLYLYLLHFFLWQENGLIK